MRFGLRVMISKSITHDGFAALYFGSVTITAFGYDDFVPPNNFCKVSSVFEVMAGYFVCAVFVSSFLCHSENFRLSGCK
jgi:hypothetical protein